MEHKHDFVRLFYYIQDTRDCTHWFYQCSECNMLRYDYHGDSGWTKSYYQNGKFLKSEPASDDV